MTAARKKSDEPNTIVRSKDGEDVLFEVKGQPYGALPVGSIVSISAGITARCMRQSAEGSEFWLL